MNLLLIPIAFVVALLVYCLSCHVFRTYGMLNTPRLLALCVAVLSGLSLLHLADAMVTFILLPYAALGMVPLILFLRRYLRRPRRNRRWHPSTRGSLGTTSGKGGLGAKTVAGCRDSLREFHSTKEAS